MRRPRRPFPRLLVFAAIVLAGGMAYATAGVEDATSPAAPTQSVPQRLRTQAGYAPSQARPTTAVTAQAVVQEYCVGCHNDRLKTAGLSLAGLDAADPAAQPDVWEAVLHKMRTGQMPPAGRPKPSAAEADAAMTALEAALDQAAAERPHPGRVGVHRLNRTEYANAIRDLLTLDVDPKVLLLPDEADEGFDNVALSLALSPAHLERYLSAAREIARLAIGDPSLGNAPASATYRVPRLLEQDGRVDDDTPFGSRGGLAVRHTFPLDGEYTFRIRLRRQVYDYIIGMGHQQSLDLRVDGQRVARFTVGGEATGTPGPLTWNGEIVGETPWELYMHAADADLESRVRVTAGPHVVSAAFVATPWEPDGIKQPLQVDFGRGSDEQYDGYAAVDSLVVVGPYAAAGSGDTPSRRAVLTCVPKDEADGRACATDILTRLARRAYRRPVTDADLQPLLRFYEEAATARGFEAGIQAALERMLVSFNFLFRLERDPAEVAPGTPYRMGDVELASRLSFFIWSSIPDEVLLAVAERGELSRPGVLEQQVRRMLADARAEALVSNFAFQWLGLRKAETALPDPNIFPEFDENLRRAFLRESALFLSTQFRENRSVLDLIGADHSFINERLAEHYGLRGIYGERFRKVTFSTEARGGLLGQGAVLLVTSYPDRTTPVLRGTWVLENLLGMPPPPPPPNVPDLEATAPDGRVLSVREQMEVHRRNPACAVCHVRMDPLGFSLENFDAIGRWRTESNGLPVDASAEFADGTPIDGARGLKQFVLQHEDNYVRTVATKLLTFALGRHLDARDQPALRAIVRAAAADDYRWSSFVTAVARSVPFQMRTSAP